jgi:hypothetical protein
VRRGTSSTAANCPVRLIASRAALGSVATSCPATDAVPTVAFVSVARMRIALVLPAPFVAQPLSCHRPITNLTESHPIGPAAKLLLRPIRGVE